MEPNSQCLFHGKKLYENPTAWTPISKANLVTVTFKCPTASNRDQSWAPYIAPFLHDSNPTNLSVASCLHWTLSTLTTHPCSIDFILETGLCFLCTTPSYTTPWEFMKCLIHREGIPYSMDPTRDPLYSKGDAVRTHKHGVQRENHKPHHPEAIERY